MNSVDRSVALMDYALRRRFGFVYFAPDLECIRERWARMNHIDDIIGAITKLNEWLRERLSPEHMVGQSFFLSEAHPLDKPGSLQRVWAIDIAPLLEEYLFHDREQMKEVRKMWAQWTDGIDRSRRDAARP
jgi:5-methylcytosine-specific restriction enzyme B